MIDALESQDLKRIAHLQPQGWDRIVPIFRFYLEQPFCTPIKVESEGRIVGIGSAISNGRTGWLGHIIVDPIQRGQGLGRALTESLMEILLRSGCTTQLLIATTMGEPVYRKLGFRVSCTYRFLDGGPIPGKAASPLRKITDADRASLLELDQRATGEDRQAIFRPCVRKGWIYAGDNNHIRGFYLPTLSEGPIVAEDPEAGLALLQLKHSRSGGKAVLPETNEAAIAYLEDHGFEPFSRAPRMVYGGEDPVDERAIFSRVGGHFG